MHDRYCAKHTSCGLQSFTGLLDISFVVFKRIIPNVKPSIPMGTNLMAFSYTCLRERWVSLHSNSDGPKSHVPAEFLHEAKYPPSTAPTAILVVLLAVQVSLFSTAARRTFLPQVGFAGAIAIQWVALASFLVVQHEGDCNAGTVWPLCVMAIFTKTWQNAQYM